MRLILRTLGDVFPDVTVWHIENDIALVARERPIVRNLDRMEARFGLDPVRKFFFGIGIYDVFSLLSLQLASEDGFRKLVDDGPLHVDDLPLLEYRAPRAQFARSYAFFLTAFDERRRLASSSLLITDWLHNRKVGNNEVIDFTLMQSLQRFSPDAFRFMFFDRVLADCKEPWTLARIVSNLEHTKREKESDRAMAALVALDPSSPRTLMLRAQVIMRKKGNDAAGKDPEMREILTQCVAGSGQQGRIFRDTCRQMGEMFSIALPAAK